MRRCVPVLVTIGLWSLGESAYADPVGHVPVERIAFHPNGSVPRGHLLFAESEEFLQPVAAQLVDASGITSPLTLIDSVAITCRGCVSQMRHVYETEWPLDPGDYTLRLVDERSTPTQARFSVTDEPPPAVELLPPASTWRAEGYTASPSAPTERVFHGEPSSGDSYRFAVEVAPTRPAAPGHIEVELLDERGATIHRVAAPVSESPSLSWPFALTSEQPFVACVSVTSHDMFGRVSAPTIMCRPDQCIARYEGDDWDIDWGDVGGCEDWSPGYAERHAEGCACAQSPGPPTGGPGVLVLFILGLWSVRARSALQARRELLGGQRP